MYVCMHACMHACMHVCMYVCMLHEGVGCWPFLWQEPDALHFMAGLGTGVMALPKAQTGTFQKGSKYLYMRETYQTYPNDHIISYY